MPVFPPLIYGTNDRQPPNMLTLIVWRKLLFVPVPVTMHFPIMPESMSILLKFLTTVTPSREGGWVDDYGLAPSPVKIRGTFGYNTKGYFQGGPYTGFGWVKYLEWIVNLSHKQQDDGSMPTVWLMSHASQHYYEVELMDIDISQDVSRNMLWVYAMNITILKPIEGNVVTDAILLGIRAALEVKNISRTIRDISSIRL